MKLIKLVLSIFIIVSLILYLYANIRTINEGQGYLLLYFSLIVFGGLFLLDGGWNLFIRLNYTLLFLIVFLIYFMVNYWIDSTDIAAFKGVTIGTTGGVVFGLVIGFTASFAMDVIYRICSDNKFLGRINFGFVFLLTLISAYLFNDVYSDYLSRIRSDIYLISDEEGFYQRAANFMFIYFIVLVSLVVQLFALKKYNFLISLLLVGLLFVNAALMGTISQLIGSNSGLATVIGLFVVFLTWLYIYAVSSASLAFNKINIKNTFFGWLGKRIIVASLFSLLTLTLAIYYLVQRTGIDLNKLRIFGFGSGSVGSVGSRFGSRLEILQSNFVEHLSYSILLGNTQVDTLTTGTGTYVHSILLSVLSHLGIVGLLLFFIFNLFIYRDITHSNIRNSNGSLNSNNIYSLYRYFAIGTVLVFGTLTAFFTWIPYWFAVGFFGGLAYKRAL